MENGLGVAEESHPEGLKISDDGVSHLKTRVGGFHEHKDSEGDDVFEEAVELSVDEENDVADGLKRDLVDDADFADANGDGDPGFSVLEGNSGLEDEDKTTGLAVEGSNEAGNGEQETAEERDVSLSAEEEDSSVSQLNDNDRLGTGDQRVADHEDGHSTISHDDAMVESLSRVSQVDLLPIEDIKPLVCDEDVIEKSVITSENSGAEKMEGDDSGASASKDTEDAAANGHVNHESEIAMDHGDSSSGISSEDQAEKLKDCGSTEAEGTSASTHLGLQGSNGVASEDSEIRDGPGRPEDNQIISPQGHQDEDPVVEETSLDTSVAETSETGTPTPLATPPVENHVKNETVASSSGAKDNSSDQLKSSGIAVADRQALPEGRAVAGGKREEENENSQGSRETTKPAHSAASSSERSASPAASSERSANPVVPPARPAGLGPAAPLLEPAPRAAHQPRANGQLSQVQSNVTEGATNGDVEEGDEVREKLQMIRVKFLRLAHRLGQTPHNVVVAQVLYRLGLAEQLRASNGGRVGAFSFDRASAMAEQLEATGQEPLDFSCTIMVLGKTGVGKSATINSIFDEVKFKTDAFQMGTKKVQDVVGTVQGIKVRVIDTPGLLSSCADQRQNEKILHSVKRFIKKSPPDIVLYLDRLDMPSRDFADMPLLRTITEIFGPSIWFNAIVVLTHAASAPPEGPNGTATTYDMFVTQRSHAVQQAIRQAAGDMRLMNPVSLVENHSACRTNRAGQRVLPNGQVWKPHLLLLSFASKILAEANTLLKLQDTPTGRQFSARSRAPPLPFLLSSLLQSRPQLKLPEEQMGEEDALDDDLDASSGSDDESKYDELPPFKPLTKAQLAELPKHQRRAYYDELEYREKLLMKKQLKEERRRRRMMKKMAAAAKDMPEEEYSENVEEESSGAASVAVPMPDLALPASFDSDNPTHRYRYLDTSNQWLVRPVLDSHGWDHDVGYEGINVERMFVVKNKIPVSFSGQVSKDKKEANLQMEVAGTVKHGEGKGTTLGFDMQSVGKDVAYTLRSETRFSNYRHNKATAGLSFTVLGDALSGGVKLEDKLIVNKRFKMVMSGGAMASRGDVAYGGSLEATFRDKDYPLGRFLSTLGLSIMDWHGELAVGCNAQSQIPIGRFTNLIARANLNNRGSGQLSLRLNSSEQVQLALIGLVPLLRKLMGGYQDLPFGQ